MLFTTRPWWAGGGGAANSASERRGSAFWTFMRKNMKHRHSPFQQGMEKPIRRKLTCVVVQLLWALAACDSSGDPPPVQTPAKLAFTVQPTAVIPGAPIRPSVAVTVQDEQGNRVTAARATVTIALAKNSAGGTLSGTVTAEAVNGVAAFSELSLDRSGTGYVLTANAEGLGGASSVPFD